MRSAARRKLRQDAVYWAPKKGTLSGQVEFEDPVALKVRWEEREEEFLDRAGNRQVSSAVVYVGCEVKRLGVLAPLCLADLTDEERADPFGNDGAYEIRKVNRTVSTRNRVELRKAML